MSGFVEELLERSEALKLVCDSLSFPFKVKTRRVDIENACGLRLGEDLKAPEPHPPFPRSLRDGYAVRSTDVIGASPSSPVFLRKCGIVPMGGVAEEPLPQEGAMQIFTGGILPCNGDAVVMLEDTEESGPWIEVRKSVTPGENVIFQGEEIATNDVIAEVGDILDFKNIPAACGLGVRQIDVIDLEIGILSTGDEVVDISTKPLPPGCVRDVNGVMLHLLLKHYGFHSRFLGIVPDDFHRLKESVENSLENFDVIILSGGSSVSSRDFCYDVIQNLGDPGLIVRGINMKPGKPTLIGGINQEGSSKLVLSLPGHPLSCSVVARVVLLPLLDMMIGGARLYEKNFKIIKLICLDDFISRSGVEEYIPVSLKFDGVVPVNSKSGYISALKRTAGLAVLPVSRETARKGEEIEVILW
ncbi:molybdopterin molybdotransferase [Acetomicrobium thermoterrenum DSM 13490]|uniref:Molybdopterin molybdenumtransferase n=1 Tax=Acetomicrobium thermoterrenum DSM 13490 TaxID=1120987 RepID=A0A1H3EPN5_9BACT|nr:molybdopterin molybdotransferase MoeA [Acetomicrobium thermoterrenum]SDX80565.1 molybdopterin molybdotransferase [Acetomicrobium thermoterrenum DSM 13490]